MKEEEANSYLDTLEIGSYITINIPIYINENLPVTAMYLGKISKGDTILLIVVNLYLQKSLLKKEK